MIRIIPELVDLPKVPRILKISEIPSGVWVMKRNLPFNLNHLAKVGIKKAFIMSRTTKSLMTMLGEESDRYIEMKSELVKTLRSRYPVLARHLGIRMQTSLKFGSRRGSDYYPQYVADIPRLVETLDECGFSALPLGFFQFQLEQPLEWISFFRRGKLGFAASQIGRKIATDFTREQLEFLINFNPMLQRMKVFLCETRVATGKWLTCAVPVATKNIKNNDNNNA